MHHGHLRRSFCISQARCCTTTAEDAECFAGRKVIHIPNARESELIRKIINRKRRYCPDRNKTHRQMSWDIISLTALNVMHEKTPPQQPHLPHIANLRIRSLIKEGQDEISVLNRSVGSTTVSPLLPKLRNDLFSWRIIEPLFSVE